VASQLVTSRVALSSIQLVGSLYTIVYPLLGHVDPDGTFILRTSCIPPSSNVITRPELLKLSE
jgi:hypothetical protein